jgi:hypothetical protein
MAGAKRKCDWSQTFTGRKVHAFDLRPDEVCIEDIAHSLALQTRYLGHCLEFLSVAQHSVLMARLVTEAHPNDPLLALEVLLHDAHEAYFGDTIRPQKMQAFVFLPCEGMVPRRVLEKRAQKAIHQALGVPVETSPEHQAIIDKYDNAMLATEQRDNMHAPPEKWYLTEPAVESIFIRPWSPEASENAFLTRYHELHELVREAV